MAAFATMAAADARAVAKVADGTWINAHSQRGITGTIGVRVQRKMSPTNPDYGAWVEITDDATT
jgi:hypothetical protein